MRDYPTLHLKLNTNQSKGTAYSKEGYGCKWTWDYPTLHLKLNTNQSKGTAYSKEGYGCKWTWETIQRYT